MDALDVQTLLETPTVQLRDVCCSGLSVEPTEDEFTSDLRLVFPYRGVFVRHVGDDQAVAEANQVLFFNAGESYRVSHPVPGGDACLSLGISEALLRELTPAALLRDGAGFVFAQQRLRIDPRAQVLVALLRHSTQRNIAETLEAEGLTLTLVMRALGPRTAHTPASTPGAAQAGRYDDLTTLGLDLGFSSHSHFTSAFTQAYGRSPSEFRQAVLRRS